MRLQWAQIVEANPPVAGVQKLRCQTIEVPGAGSYLSAIHYLAFGPAVAVGQMVLLNVTALDLELGTGGWAFAVPAKSFSDYQPTNGHVIKLRYTPLQREVQSVEEPSSPNHQIMHTANSLDGLPVVCCSLHSQVPLVAAAIKHLDSQARIVYCLTDQAALMMSFSELVGDCLKCQLIDATVSCGQAMGGDLEAVNLHSGLLAARWVLKADYVICAIGPGVVGTDTPFGHGGIAQAEALNAVYALAGQPVASLRVSAVDQRSRHWGLSHHSASALGRACLAPVTVALPSDLDAAFLQLLQKELQNSGISQRHQVVLAESLLEEVDLRGVKPSSMGRGLAQDPPFFKAACCAGVVAHRLAQAPADDLTPGQ